MAREGYEPIADSSTTDNGKRRIILIVVGILFGVIVAFRYIPFLNGLFWKGSCALAIPISGYDTLDTDRYKDWFNDDATMHLAQSGTFTGPEQMKEYVNFVNKGIYFDKYERLESTRQFKEASGGQCVVNMAFQNRAQVNAKYSNSGEAECVVTVVGAKLTYAVGLFGFGFNIKRIDLFYPEKFLGILFNDMIGGPATTDYICDTVLRDNCAKVYKENELDEETCKDKYNALAPVDEYGYLDDKAKGCRILHSTFAEINAKHCPHLSFTPMEDYQKEIWCQESGGTKAEELWSDDELDWIKQFALDSGYDPETLSTSCVPE